ncbi:MAG TPA: ABC transporter ATP-binding protein [Polyangia bacterium]|nr:ABC transporter ATP-binding protein [Polyangia bacterium]
MTALSVENVHVSLGTTRALDGVTFAVEPGWTSIVGPNGAGKSTLLRVLAGLLAPDAGDVRLDGKPLASWPPRARGSAIAWLGQPADVQGELTALDVVRLGRLPKLGLFAAPTADDEARVERAMADAECAAWRDRRLQELSGGERQRVLFARALAVGAPVLLLDEPTTHLDPPHQGAMARLLRRQVQAGTSVVSVLHDLSIALLADRVVILAGGRIRASGASDDPALHAALADVFGGAIRVERAGARFVVVPQIET